MQFYKLLIDGQDIDTGDYEYFPYADAAILDYEKVSNTIRKFKAGIVEEATQKIIYAKYCVGDSTVNENAIASASEAFKQFQKFSTAKRFKMLSDMRKILIEKEKDLLELLIIEGHPAKLAEWEISGMKEGLASETLDFYKLQSRKEIGVIENERIYWARRPDGVVCLEPPRNAPCSNSFTAILTFIPGNSLIVKPPLRNPIATLFLWRHIVYPALMEHGAPKGILNIVLGNSKALLDQWLESPEVKDIIYFGDSERGLRIGKEIFQKGKKPILELSGNDFLVVWKDADLEQAASSLSDAFIGSTQICMVPKTALIHEDVYDDFLAVMKQNMSSIKAGLPSHPETCLSPVTRVADYRTYVEDALLKGGEIVFGGRRLNHFHEMDPKGLFIEPTLVKITCFEKAKTMKCVNEETFFPLLPLVSVGSSGNETHLSKDEVIFDHMIEMINRNQYGLRFSLWIRSPRYLRKFAKYVNNAGLFRINSRHIGFSAFLGTHGGPNRSGGPFGEMNYIWQKTSHLQGISVQK